MKRSYRRHLSGLASLLAMLFSISTWATPITTFTSVPVAKGGYAASLRFLYGRLSNGPLSQNLTVEAPFFGYGITDRVAILSIFPIVQSDFNGFAAAGIPDSNDFGLSDFQILSRVQVFRKYGIAQNLGVTILAGLEIPSGDGPFSSNSVDFPFGFTFGWQTTGNEVDLDFIYQVNTEGGGVHHGDKLNFDIAYSRRLLPWKLPDQGEPFIWNIVLELNGQQLNSSSLSGGGGTIPDTGGFTLFFSPGFEFIFKNFGVQVGTQIPIIQDLNGTQLETDFNVLFNFGYTGAFF